MMNYEAMTQMTDAEINKRISELDFILMGDCANDAWDRAYKERSKLSTIQNIRYRERNQAAFDAFYEKHIKGRSWEEIHPNDWSFYSDWHKDMYGYRPRHI